jgi:hypothetical protein
MIFKKVKEKITNAAMEIHSRPINYHQVSLLMRATEPSSDCIILELILKKELDNGLD